MDDGFQFIDIILFAMIAVFLVLRLRSVLGRRDGHENKFRDRFKDHIGEQANENVVELSSHDEPSPDEDVVTESAEDMDDDDNPLSAGLTQIQHGDPDFQPEEFLSGARIAFELIIEVYAAGDTGALKPLLNPDVFANFSQAVRDREQAGETLEDKLVGIKTAEIVEAYMENRIANITVKFVSDQINVTRDENGDVVDGNPNAVIKVVDFWTFAHDTKSSDPNWLLVATSSLD